MTSVLLKFVKALLALSTALIPASVSTVAVVAAIGTTVAVTAGCAPSDGDDDGGDDDDGDDD
ncbi:hypothetical protein [Actinomadura rudentiformis]|uniref:Uncharacterized protein n=1 Tax=Actinomadura rudentiformis TaxID=359158 RepID=A0A6H9YYH8_9ACTN|nr:hypothetical protein [Actinomadura rudentiformis]KAB2352494.1 hypothetical protein F8566_02085 [Actinomadura rudentiformis]